MADGMPYQEQEQEQEQELEQKQEQKGVAPKGAVDSCPVFETFWREFPSGRKQGKEAARKAFVAALKRASDKTIIEAAREYAASPVGQGEYVKAPTTWLNQSCWEDDRKAWQRSGNGSGKQLFDPDDPTGNMAVARRYIENRNGEDD